MTIFVVSNNETEIKNYVEKGFIPVECSIGGKSIVDDLVLDHHNSYSNLEGVAIRGYRDLYGSCKDVPGFVVAGNADADATFCVASLMGIIPHPDYEIPNEITPHIAKTLKRDLMFLANHINSIDVDPINTDLFAPGGEYLQLWQACSGNGRDSMGFVGGVSLWRAILTAVPGKINAYLKAPIEVEKVRKELSMEDLKERAFYINNNKTVMGINGSRVFGFPEWYAVSPVVLALTENGNITIGVKDKKKSEILFGKGGLKNVFPFLTPIGWGGREAVGGSPRGLRLTRDQLSKNMKIVISKLI